MRVPAHTLPTIERHRKSFNVIREHQKLRTTSYLKSDLVILRIFCS